MVKLKTIRLIFVHNIYGKVKDEITHPALLITDMEKLDNITHPSLLIIDMVRLKTIC